METPEEKALSTTFYNTFKPRQVLLSEGLMISLMPVWQVDTLFNLGCLHSNHELCTSTKTKVYSAKDSQTKQLSQNMVEIIKEAKYFDFQLSESNIYQQEVLPLFKVEKIRFSPKVRNTDLANCLLNLIDVYLTIKSLTSQTAVPQQSDQPTTIARQAPVATPITIVGRARQTKCQRQGRPKPKKVKNQKCAVNWLYPKN